MTLNDEELKKKKEKARLMRNSIGMITSNDIENSTSTNISIESNSYQERLQKAKELRNSVGFTTPKDYLEQENIIDKQMEEKNTTFETSVEPLNNTRQEQETIEQEETITENESNNLFDKVKKNINENTELQKYVKEKKEEETKIRKEEIEKLKSYDWESVKNSIQEKYPDLSKTNLDEVYNELQGIKEEGNQYFDQILKRRLGKDTITKDDLSNVFQQIIEIGYEKIKEDTDPDVNELSTREMVKKIIAHRKNENIKKGGLPAIYEYADTLFTNAASGFALKPLAGLTNLGTTAVGLGIKVLEGGASLFGNKDAANSLNSAYNSVIDYGSQVHQSANLYSDITNQVEDGFVRGSGMVTDIVSNVIGNFVLGYATGIEGTVMQGLTVGGSSAQEVLEENKNNIGQATIVGLAKGYVSYFTEKIFDYNILTRGTNPSSIQEKITNNIINHISSNFGKRFAYNTIGILGENAEEFIEDNIDNILDNVILGKETPMPFSKEWLASTGETGMMTTMSTIVLNLLGFGGSNTKPNAMVKAAEELIVKDDMAIHYDPDKIKTADGMEQFYVTNFNQDGELTNITPTWGKEINNIRSELMINPVIVKDSNTNKYEVIDGTTGVILDNSYYSTLMEAESGFDTKVSKLSNQQINDINNTINKANYVIQNNIMDIATRIKENVSNSQIDELYNTQTKSNTTQNDEIKNKSNLNNEETSYTPNKVKNITDLFKTKSDYTKNEMANIWNNDVDKNNLNVIYDNGKIKSYIAIEEDGDNLNISQYDSNDNIVKTETIMPQNEIFTSESINNAIEKVTGVYNQNNVNKTPNESTFYNDQPIYAISNINEIETELNKKKSYTLEQIGETWSDIKENTYDLTLEDNMYVELEEDNGKLESVLYDGSTEEIPEVKRVAVEKTKNGRYTAEAINNAIKEVATIPNENKPIQGQVDIEGNIVNKNNIKEIDHGNVSSKRDNSKKSISNNSSISQKNDNVKTIYLNDYDNKTARIILSSSRNIIINSVEQLDTLIDEALNNGTANKALHFGKLSIEQTDKIKNSISNLPTDKQNYLQKETYDIVMNQSEIRHLKEDKSRITNQDIHEYVKKIPEIISNFDSVYYSKNNKHEGLRFTKKIDNETYYSFSLVSNQKGTLTIQSTSMNSKDYENKKRSISLSNDVANATPDNTSKTNKAFASITNSIAQKNQDVKVNTQSNSNIQDFGEKIGGARKDLATSRANTKTGKEVIHDYTVQNTDNEYTVNFKKRVLKGGFKTQAEAEKYILDFKNNIKDNRAFVHEATNRDGETKYMIYLRNPRTLKSQYVGKIFANKIDAENYAIALSIYLKENGKNLFRPQIQQVERTNENNKNATKATGNDILKNFGFKGGEFGNWVTQNERQQFLNYAQDAFTDLAAALDITPESLGQQGAMSIAFGARGKGLTGAVAHFEPAKKVINMTRLKGAGSLAHEFGHSIDNYISRVGGYDEDGMATTNLRNPKLSENMQKAVREVVDAMRYNVSTNQEEVDKKNAIYEKARKENLEYNLRYIDKVFNGNAHNYRRIKGKYEEVPIKVTAKQKTDYQKIRNTLMEGGLKGDIDYKITNTRSLKAEKIYPEPINTLQKMYKEVVGRKIDDDTVYSIYRNGRPTRQVTEVKSESAYSKSALELDRETGRSAAYFSRIDEMWARAFESYISDKLKAKGIKDTYLVHSVNNNEYALFNPFPAGEERKNINKSFDNLIQTMKDEGYFTESEAPQNYDEDTGIRYMKKNTSKVTDNQGRILTKQQQEYFKDSKIRDEKGNLETVYHGTLNYGFTEFEGGHWGANFYTNNKNVAESYFINSSKNNGIYEGYLNITKPLEVDMQGRNWSEIRRSFITDKEILDLIDQDFGKPYDIFSTTDVIIATKKSGKYDGVIFKNIYDDASSRKINLGNDYVTFNSNQFKNIDNQNPTSSSDIRYMKKSNNKKVIDNKGNVLSQQQQDYFKNSKLRNNKNELEVVYHTTPNVFTEFDNSRLGDNTLYDNTAFGHFVTTNQEFSKRFGDIDNKGIESHTMEMYANVENPITHPYNAHYKYNGDELNNIVIKYFEAINEKEGLEQLKEFAEEEETSLYDTYMNMTIDNDLFDNAAEERKILKEKGYDAVEFVEGLESNLIENSNSNKPVSSYAIFNSKQLKNINNITPTINDDIRFAKRSAKELNDNLRNAERGESYIEQEIQKIEKTGNWDNSIPVTKLSDIRKTIEDYLGLGIKKGHFRQDAYAIYKGNNDVIRTKEYKDMDSILHETGHAIDMGKRLNVDKESIADELLTAIDKLGGYEDETRTIKLEEGFAEVIREYSIVPEQAKVDYPQTIAVLEGLKKTDKKFNNFITKVQQQSYNYIHQNPRNRTLSNISIGEQTDKSRITKNFIKQEVMRNIYDKDWAVKSAVNELAKANGKTVNQIRASENAYYLTRLAAGTTDRVISMLSEGYITENGTKLFPGLNKLGDIIGTDSQRWNDLRAYLVAQRDLEYKAKTLKTGIRTMDSKAVVEQFKNDKQIQQASKLIYDTLNGVMQYAVNNNLINQETADSLKQSNAFYVPMQRVLENQGNKVGRRGAVADIIQKRTGSELDVKDVLENIVANSSNIIQQVENNNALKALYKEGQTNGLTGTIYDIIDTPMTKIGTAQLSTWENELKKQGVNTANLDLEKTVDIFAPNKKVDMQNLITSFINDNGKRIYLQFNDEILFNSLMNMDKKFMSQILRINSKMNMPLRYGATMANLGFAIPNMISDTAQAAVYSTAGFIPVVDNALGVLDILASTNNTVRNFVNKVAPDYANRINALYSLYQQSGATNSTRLSQYRESTQNLMADVYGTKSKTLGIKEKFKPLKRLLDILTYIPEISEQSTRFEVFKKNYKYYKNKGTAEMDARILAALESRDATQDFGRTGNITREINQLIPFSAARVGSAYTFAEKIKANPKQVGLRIAILTAIAMGIKALGYDDKEIEELNQRKKDDNFVVKMGNTIVTIKKPQGILRSMINLAEYIQDLSTDHIEKGKEGDRLGSWLNNAIMDNMPADEVTGLVPNAVAPLIENAINKDFYYNTDIVKSYDLDLPDSEQYYDYNSQLAIWLGKMFNYSPAKIDNLISGYFGGLGTTVTSAMDYGLGKAGVIPEKPEMGAEQDAIGKRFIVNVNTNSSSIDEIYTRKTELTKLKNGGTISSEEEQELEKIKSAISTMSNINKQIKEIKQDLTMSGTEKAQKIKILQQQKTDTARQALGKELINIENTSKIQSSQFYPNDTIKKNGYSITLTSMQKKEYEQIANEYYNKYAKQGLYSKEKLEEIKSKAKEYAKAQIFKKYRTQIVKTK